MITRERALEILNDHGVASFDEDRSTDGLGGWVGGSSFDDEIEPKDSYRLMDVLGWLGYCCPHC